MKAFAKLLEVLPQLVRDSPPIRASKGLLFAHKGHRVLTLTSRPYFDGGQLTNHTAEATCNVSLVFQKMLKSFVTSCFRRALFQGTAYNAQPRQRRNVRPACRSQIRQEEVKIQCTCNTLWTEQGYGCEVGVFARLLAKVMDAEPKIEQERRASYG